MAMHAACEMLVIFVLTLACTFEQPALGLPKSFSAPLFCPTQPTLDDSDPEPGPSLAWNPRLSPQPARSPFTLG